MSLPTKEASPCSMGTLSIITIIIVITTLTKTKKWIQKSETEEETDTTMLSYGIYQTSSLKTE